MTVQETQLLTAQNINPEVVKNFFKNPLILGQGFSSIQLDGGENISNDLGETSEFFVCSPRLQYNAEYTVEYCMTGKISKKDKKMDGKLSLSWTRSRQVVKDGKSEVVITSAQVDLIYKSDANQVFYKQYFGSWSGDSFSLINGFTTNQLQKLEIQERESGKYLVKFNNNSLTYNGEVFTFQESENLVDVSELLVSEFPAIGSIYLAPSGRKLVLVAQIWSLGDLTGTVVLIQGDDLLDVATVRLKKD